ncbi:unnamed protein product [Trichobilharzia szidati]|nr:unnamed protein product [Trichobilharzia szidati]
MCKALIQRQMSSQISTLSTWKSMHVNKTSNRFLNYFIWMLVDAFLMILVTAGMVVMVNTIGKLDTWIEKHYYVSYIFMFSFKSLMSYSQSIL